ncbi:hypothetical protein ACO0QE_001177 [Hanseniaspora vineae]
MAPVFFSDISKNVNGLLNRDFYHGTPASVDVKTTAPNGVAFTAKGKTNPKTGAIASSVEARFSDKQTGLTLTQSLNNASALETKVELADLTPGLKAELATSLIPGTSKAVKLNLNFVQPYFAARGFFDLLKGPSFVGDLAVARDGFTAGAEVGYDLTSAAITKYAAALGYTAGAYSLTVGADKNQVFTGSFYQRVSPVLEVGAKSTYASLTNANAIEFATKYDLDATSSVKAKIQDSGIVDLAYKQDLRKGVTLGVGASFNALKLEEPVHKLGWSLSFSA